MEAKKYESKSQLAERLGVTCRTINYWMSQGRIPYCRMSDRVIRFVPSDVDAALGKFTVNAVGSGRAA